MAYAWSDEEVANRREGPLVGSFFVKGRDFLCPLPSGWIGSPRGFVDSFTAFPMLPSPVCACVWFVGDPGIEDPVGLPPYWCRDRTVRRNISRGVAPVGHDLIAGRLCPQDLLVGNAAGCLPAFSDRSQRFGVVLIVLPRLFARCLELEGLSRSVVVSVYWDPRPREPVEGVLRATSVLELATHFLAQTRQSFVSLPRSTLFRSRVGRSGVRPQLGQAAVLRVLCVSVAALSRPCARAEAGARLESGACGLRVPLLAASGGGLVAVVVTIFSSRRFQVFLVARACTAVIARLCLVSVGIVACDGTDVCSFPTWRCVQGLGWFCLCAEHYFRLCPTPLGSAGVVCVARRRLVVVALRFLAALAGEGLVGCSCCCAACVASVVARRVRAVVARLALDSLAVTEVHRLVALCSGGGFSELFVVVLNDALVVLVEVLPGLACVASVVLLAVVFSLMCAVRLGCVLVRFSQDGSWHFWWRFSPKLLRVVLVVVALSLCRDSGLVSAVGVWLAVLRMEVSVSRCGFASRMWKRLVFVSFLCFSLVARGGDAPLWCCVATVRIVPVGLVRVVIEVVLLALAHQGVAAVFTPCVAEAGVDVACCALSGLRFLACGFRFVTRRGGPSRSGCRGLKAQAGYPFPLSLLFFPFPSSPTVGRLPFGDRSVVAPVGSWRRRGACLERGADSFTAFPMLPSPVCACVWFVGDPGIEDPVGLPPCWCRDRTVRRDISRGVAPGGCRDALLRRIRVHVAAPFPGKLCPQDLLVGNAAGSLPAFSDRSQRFGVVLVVLPRLFARCLTLEGLSRSEVVSVSWDPRPREPVKGVLRATSVLELAAHVSGLWS
ncbi:hypothetical protein Taro_009912 [Colocasia esculenta]|uniref:Uncharacterized protein n=1 Tax=Colocasia esculenta TaxID=4460 RepID=A0A843TXK0_COLES|nr:hypothetical protein [Colocasia esculenta]